MKTSITQEFGAQSWFYKILNYLSPQFFPKYEWNFSLLQLGKEGSTGVSVRTPGMGVPGVKLQWTGLLLSPFSRSDGENKFWFLQWPTKALGHWRKKWFSKLLGWHSTNIETETTLTLNKSEILRLSFLTWKSRNNRISFSGLLQRFNESLCLHCWSQGAPSQTPCLNWKLEGNFQPNWCFSWRVVVG